MDGYAVNECRKNENLISGRPIDSESRNNHPNKQTREQNIQRGSMIAKPQKIIRAIFVFRSIEPIGNFNFFRL